MELQSINVKIFVDGELSVEPSRFMGVFQQWVKEQHRPELLVDMADYRHVPDGPGVLCVGLEADYAMDHRAGRWGLLYNRKAPVEGSNADRFAQALRAAASACEKLESDFGAGLKFSRTDFEILVNDRGFAVNSDEHWKAMKPDVETFLKELTSGAATVTRFSEDPRSRLGASIHLAKPLNLAVLAAV